MLLYIEACRAGSMFDGILSENTNGTIKFSQQGLATD